jgi:hypothetical protein
MPEYRLDIGFAHAVLTGEVTLGANFSSVPTVRIFSTGVAKMGGFSPKRIYDFLSRL